MVNTRSRISDVAEMVEVSISTVSRVMNGTTPEDDESLIAAGGFNSGDAVQTISFWLAEGLRLDAVFAGDDASAAGDCPAVFRQCIRSLPGAAHLYPGRFHFRDQRINRAHS